MNRARGRQGEGGEFGWLVEARGDSSSARFFAVPARIIPRGMRNGDAVPPRKGNRSNADLDSAIDSSPLLPLLFIAFQDFEGTRG